MERRYNNVLSYVCILQKSPNYVRSSLLSSMLSKLKRSLVLQDTFFNIPGVLVWRGRNWARCCNKCDGYCSSCSSGAIPFPTRFYARLLQFLFIFTVAACLKVISKRSVCCTNLALALCILLVFIRRWGRLVTVHHSVSRWWPQREQLLTKQWASKCTNHSWLSWYKWWRVTSRPSPDEK